MTFSLTDLDQRIKIKPRKKHSDWNFLPNNMRSMFSKEMLNISRLEAAWGQ